ncbi:solute carrier family 2, facilitated glucose transporter member 1-like isoform X4 [Homalodisca vitripennis]|uniref:solute carrier family 2, facilitated glucose transporter member 1-like isoform X4 n=1 Tax=Homalodisca vitripennis TaxID=197043 RepID=UPI001EEC249D|nr:solute carrier family 2, facilitated glucose transporter member 1-like isoform X4 [Homalodisca vitripennis]
MEDSPQPTKSGLNGRLLFAIAVAAVGSSFQHGYNTGVVNAPQKVIEAFIRDVLASRKGESTKPEDISQESVTTVWATAVAIYCVGGMLGGALVGLTAKTLGPKGGLFWNNLFVFIGALLQGFSKSALSYELIVIGRFIIGINSGLNAGLAPMYLTEISPVNLRGAVGSTYQLVLTISILISQIMGLSSVMGTADLWPILLIVCVLPAVFMVLGLPFCPESPKYLLTQKSKDEKAQKALTWFRGTTEVQDEMEEMRVEKEQIKHMPKVTMKEMLVNRSLRIPLMIAVVIMLGQQFSGINAKQYNYVWVSYLCIAFVLFFVIMFAVGPGSIPWFLVNELFNQSARPMACSIAVTTNWTANFFVGMGFPFLKIIVAEFCMVIFVIFQFLTVLFICIVVPETKQRPIAEIVALFSKQTPDTPSPDQPPETDNPAAPSE